jgi:isocitrate/isopropylmalate dehydrogenase
MFEPVHGSAHDSVGSDRVNASSQILSAVMMLEFLGETDAGSRIRKALDDVLAGNPVPNTIGDLVAGRL